MIIVLLILAFLRTLHGVPISITTSNIDTLMIRDNFIIGSDDANTRSKYDIVKGCLLTVLACVWTSAHPNIPGPRDSTWTCLIRRIGMMILALIVPEMMAWTALRQRVAARTIADDYNAGILGLPKTSEHLDILTGAVNNLDGAETISLWKYLSDWLKESSCRAKELLKHLPKIFARGQKGWASTSTVAAGPWDPLESMPEAEIFSLQRWLSKTSLWVSAKDSLQEIFIELPEERARRGKGQTWTVTHGFFIQMGGFLLYENDYPKQVLGYDKMEELIRNKQIDAPIYTEHDLRDRSKGDTLSKGVVVLQTTWFVIQCITRLWAGLPLSELEVATLGFAVLNGIIYAIWWDKPQGVELAIFIPLKAGQLEPSRELGDLDTESRRTGSTESVNTQKLKRDVEARLRATDYMDGVMVGGAGRESEENTGYELETLGTYGDIIIPERGQEKSEEPGKRQETGGNAEAAFKLEDSESMLEVGQGISSHGYAAESVEAVSSHLETDSLMSWHRSVIEEDYTILEGAHRVSTFHTDRRGGNEQLKAYMYMLGAIFGFVHLLAWSSAFPSHRELLFWRISTLVIIAEPTVMATLLVLSPRNNTSLGKGLLVLVALVGLVGLPLYVIARVTLVILAFLSLRTLPQSVFLTIPWTSFIPHI